MRYIRHSIVAISFVATATSCIGAAPRVLSGADFSVAGKPSANPKTSTGQEDNDSNSDDKKQKVCIFNVTGASAGLIVSGDNPPGAISGSLTGRPIRLRIRGDGLSTPKPKASSWTLTMPSGVFLQTWIGPQPTNRVLIDGCIPARLVETEPLSPAEITVEVQTRSVLDWYLKGRHTLSVQRGGQADSLPITFGPAEAAGRSLGPIITSAQVIALEDMKLRGIATDDADHDDEPNVLRIEGDNLLLDYHRMWATIDGARCYFHAVQILDSSPPRMIGYVHLPKGFVRRTGQNKVQVASPFGMTFRSF